MTEFRVVENVREPCPWCEEDHGWRACPRIRRMQFFGGIYDTHHDVEAIEFWPPDGFEFEVPDDELLLVERVVEEE